MATLIATNTIPRMPITLTDTALLKLLQLSSAALPVGAYAFSQGLEYAVECGWVSDSDALDNWLTLAMTESLAKCDAPILLRQLKAIEQNNTAAFAYWDAVLLATRETAELRLTDTATAAAMQRLLNSHDVPLSMTDAIDPSEKSFVSYFALAASHWNLSPRAACTGLLWSWLENQVAAATKLVPLGQTDAQLVLSKLLEKIPAAIDIAEGVSDDEIGGALPALAMASAWHESQYSRLFRS